MSRIPALISYAVIIVLSLPGACSRPEGSASKNASASFENNDCVWTFDSYESSAWEKEWIEGEETGKRKDCECEVLAEKNESDWHTEKLPITMKDSYRLFLALRNKGVRMHSWP
jgi:hypothetical protein